MLLFRVFHGKAIIQAPCHSMKRGMPPADDHLLIGIEIDRLIGPASNITKHRDLFPSNGEIGNRSRRTNIDSPLAYINETGKLPSPSTILRIEICRVPVRTSVDDFNTFGKILDLLETANRAE